MELFGKVIAALPERSGTSARGTQWRSATYVLETQEQYPKKLAFDVTNDKIGQLAIQVGEMLNVQFDINARESNGRWFNSVTAWNVVRQQPSGQMMPPQQGYQQPAYQQTQPQQWGNPQAGAYVQQGMQQAMTNAQPAPIPQQNAAGDPPF